MEELVRSSAVPLANEMTTETAPKTASSAKRKERRESQDLQQQLGQRRTPEQQKETKRAFLDRLKQEFFLDILRARTHSKHFRHTRAQAITSRVRSLSLILAVLIPAWIAIDAFYLPEQHMQSISLLRLIAGAACFALFLWVRDSHDLSTARFKLGLLVLIPSLFHTCSHLLLESGGQPLPAGYYFFPFLIISLGAIFPLTIFEGAVLACFVVGLYILTALVHNELFSMASLNDIWLLTLLALIAGWASLTQLTMMMRLYRQAHRDPLTNLANRRSIISFLGREVEYSREMNLPLSVILLDLDKFKRINDDYGHAVGDQVLQCFSALLTSQSRSEDLVGRYGGEEFLMILSATPREAALSIAERLRLACIEQQLQIDNDQALSFTTSAGVTSLRPGESIDEMMKRVDDALYNAKGYGRNRVVAV